MCESFFATLECELLDRRRFTSQAEPSACHSTRLRRAEPLAGSARMACFSFIEGGYNPLRLHSALGYQSPSAFEAAIDTVNTEP